MRNKKTWILNLVFLAAVFAATVYGVFHGKNLNEIHTYLRRANESWWLLGVVFVVVFIECEGLLFFYMVRSLGQPTRPGHCFLYPFIGFFFSSITPMGCAGQPAQIYFMKKDEIPISVTVPVLMLITITFKAVLIVVGGVVLLVRPAGIMTYLEPVIGWFWLGLGLNVVFVSAWMALIFCPKLVERPLLGGVRLVARFAPQKEAVWRKKVESGLLRYKDVAAFFKSNRSMVGNVFLITFAQRTILFAVTYLAYRSFGLSGVNPAKLIALQAMISVAADMLPIPGGMGITESLFLRIFSPICTQTLALPVMIVSRGISYYTQLLISAVFTGVSVFAIEKKKGKPHDRLL